MIIEILISFLFGPTIFYVAAVLLGASNALFMVQRPVFCELYSVKLLLLEGPDDKPNFNYREGKIRRQSRFQTRALFSGSDCCSRVHPILLYGII